MGSASGAYSSLKELFMVAFSNGELVAFNTRSGYPVWSTSLTNTTDLGYSNNINATQASPVIDKNDVLAVGSHNFTALIDIENGDIIWQKSISGNQTPIVNKDIIFMLSSNKNLLALNKKDGEILWQVDVLKNVDEKEKNEIYLSGPVLVNSKLIVTSSNGFVFTFNALNGKLESQFDIEDDIPFAPVVADQTIIFVTNKANIIAFR